MAEKTSKLLSDLAESFQRAREQSFPAFLRSIDASTPINSAPYMTGLSDLAAEPWNDGRRRELVKRLVGALNELRSMGISPEVVLIGGSFLELSREPKDLDLVIFYATSRETLSDVVAWQNSQVARGLDMRLVPVDVEPVIVLKMALFFGLLYTVDRDGSGKKRGLVIVDCSQGQGHSHDQ